MVYQSDFLGFCSGLRIASCLHVKKDKTPQIYHKVDMCMHTKIVLPQKNGFITRTKFHIHDLSRFVVIFSLILVGSSVPNPAFVTCIKVKKIHAVFTAFS